MQIVNGTYVGNDSRSNEINKALGQVGATFANALVQKKADEAAMARTQAPLNAQATRDEQQKKIDAFTELNKNFTKQYDAFGGALFETSIPIYDAQGNEIDKLDTSETAKAAEDALKAAADAYSAAYGRPADEYIQSFKTKGFTPAQMQNLLLNTQMQKNASNNNNQVLPNGAVQTGADLALGMRTGDGGQTATPPATTPPPPVNTTDTRPSIGNAAGKEDVLQVTTSIAPPGSGRVIYIKDNQGNLIPINSAPVPVQGQSQNFADRVMNGFNFAAGSGQPQMSPQQLATHEQVTGDVHIPAMVGIKEGILNENAMQHGGAQLVQKLNAQFPARNFAQGTPGSVGQAMAPVQAPVQKQVAPTEGDILANPTQVAQKDPAALAAYIKRLFDLTNAASLSSQDKGLVARAKVAQARLDLLKKTLPPQILEIASRLAQGQGQAPQGRLPTFADGTTQGSVGQSLPTQGYGDLPMADAPNSTLMNPSSVISLLQQKTGVVEPVGPSVTQSPRYMSRAQMADRMYAQGNTKAATGLMTANLKEDVASVRARVGTPAYQKYLSTMRSGIMGFLQNATPEQLFAAGYGDIVKSRQADVANQIARDQVNAQNADLGARTGLYNAQTATAYATAEETRARTGLIGAQTEAAQAQTTYALERAKMVAAGHAPSDLISAGKILDAYSKIAKNGAEFQKLAKENTSLQQALKALYLDSGGDPSQFSLGKAPFQWFDIWQSIKPSSSVPNNAVAQSGQPMGAVNSPQAQAVLNNFYQGTK